MRLFVSSGETDERKSGGRFGEMKEIGNIRNTGGACWRRYIWKL